MISIYARVASARQRLTSAGIQHDEAALDARLLAQFALGWDAARFLTAGGEAEPPGFETDYEELVARRVHREPMAYITGRQEFWGLQFEITPAVLIPRPETELIVETALELISSQSREAQRDSPRLGTRRRLAVADACTGSGCLAVALACEYADGYVVATDLSREALVVARRNALLHGVSRRACFVQTDLLAGVGAGMDLIVANPPYVPTRTYETLAPEVREHEPRLALVGGPDGLDIIRRLVAQAAHCLRPGGTLLFECGAGQSDAVRDLISAARDFRMVDVRSDLQSIPRVAVARRRSSL